MSAGSGQPPGHAVLTKMAGLHLLLQAQRDVDGDPEGKAAALEKAMTEGVELPDYAIYIPRFVWLAQNAEPACYDIAVSDVTAKRVWRYLTSYKKHARPKAKAWGIKGAIGKQTFLEVPEIKAKRTKRASELAAAKVRGRWPDVAVLAGRRAAMCAVPLCARVHGATVCARCAGALTLVRPCACLCGLRCAVRGRAHVGASLCLPLWAPARGRWGVARTSGRGSSPRPSSPPPCPRRTGRQCGTCLPWANARAL